jgi:hypothetical protein
VQDFLFFVYIFNSVAQSACLCDIKSIRAVKLLIEFVVVPPRAGDLADQGRVNGEFRLA